MDEFRGQSPYPYPQNITPNPEYAQLLKNSYSGAKSELTGILQYIYHHIRYSSIDKEIGACLQKIAIVEMHHFDLLGQLVMDLGIDPKYTYKSGFFENPWSAWTVSYGNGPKEMLELDAAAESEAIKLYEYTAQAIDDAQIQALIYRIIEDEEIHLAWFKKMAASL